MKNIFSFLLICYCCISFSQEKTGPPSAKNPDDMPKIGKIKGEVIDKSKNLPVEFATISLFTKKDTAIIGGTIADDKGAFVIQDLPFGRYFIKVNFIGYKEKIIDSVFIRPNNTEVNLGKILLAENSEILNTVEVSAEKGNMQIGIDRKVFNVDKSIVSQGGNANDVLQQIPSVNVDMDGNVSLRGSGNVTVLIDGKPSSITGSSRQAILQQIPASSIESIEVITNPSAKYDPDGMAGIINIVMKKNKLTGFNAGIVIGVGTRDKYNASANASYRTKKINIYANYGYRLDNRFGNGYSIRKNLLADTTFTLKETSSSNKRNISHNIKTGLEYYINDKNTIGASVLYNTGNEYSPQKLLFEEFDENNLFVGGYSRDVTDNGSSGNIDYSIDYRKQFSKPKQELVFTGTLSDSKGKKISNYNQYNYLLIYAPLGNSPLNQLIETTDKNKITVIQLDYTNPFKNQSKLETGLKTTLRTIDNDFYSQSFNYSENILKDDSLLNNHFIYNEQVYAAYTTYAGKFKGIGFQIGARAEQTLTESKLITTNEKYNRNYFSFFPSAHFSYKLKKEQELQLSYSRRINRPGIRSLNPFKDYTNPYNIHYGNPFLKPEYIDAYEFNYMKYFKKSVFTSSIYYRQTNDVMMRYKIIGDSTISYVTHINLNTSTSYGVEVIVKADILKWWNITASANIFRNVINAKNVEADLQNENFSYNAKLISNTRVWKNMDIQLAANYTGPWATAQGIAIPTFVIDMGIKKEIFKNATLSINVNDITDARRFGINSNVDNFEFEMSRKRESRVLMATFSYNFGTLSDSNNPKKGRGRNENMGGGMEDMGM